jgi:hypothetical protein
MSAHLLPTWQHTDTGLMVQVGRRRDRLPDPIGDWLAGPGGLGLSGDPARDLLRVERQLRHVIAQLNAEIATAEQGITAAHDQDAPNPARPRRRRPRRARRALRTALDVRAELVDSRERARTLLDILRTYVIELDAPHGLLREAADGWRRRPDPPPGVVVFDDEDAFLDTDPRRATTSQWGGTTIAGIEQFGLTWRRDGDEDADDPAASTPDDQLRRTGPWQLGYLERTGEVYGIRRCAYLPRQVWLLGAGFDTVRCVRDVLGPITPRITEPNSLILAAGTVHAAQPWPRSTTAPGPSPPRGGSGAAPCTPGHAPEEAGR